MGIVRAIVSRGFTPMTKRSIAVAAALVLVAAGSASAQSNLQAVPRAGVAFPYTTTVRATVETVDAETRTIAFTTSQGHLLDMAVSDSIRDLDSIQDGATVDITYNETVMLLNLRQKGPGSKEARRDATSPSGGTTDAGRFTMTVTAVDLANNKVSVIAGDGGEVRTLAATSIAKQDMLKKIKVGDVVIGLTTPLFVTAITPVK
jgi:hypothetical protein